MTIIEQASKLVPWKLEGGELSEVNEVKRLYAELINAPLENCISYGNSTSFAMSTAAFNFLKMGVLKPLSKIIVLDKEMASAIIPWQSACKVSSATLEVIPHPMRSGKSWSEAVIERLDENVAIVAVPNCHWCDGSFVDLQKISDAIRNMDTPSKPHLVIDGTQSIGALPIDVKLIKPSFMACSIHKWLNGPYGLSLMYLDPSLHNMWVPIDHHERNHVGSNEAWWDEEGAMGTNGYPEAFFPGAACIDGGGRPNPTTFAMLHRALTLTAGWTPSAVHGHLLALTEYLVQVLERSELGHLFVVRPADQRSGHILGIRLKAKLGYSEGGTPQSRVTTSTEASTTNPAPVPSNTTSVINGGDSSGTPVLDVSAIGAGLKKRGVFVSVRGGCLRVAPYIFNTMADMDTFVLTLNLVVKEIITAEGGQEIAALKGRTEEVLNPLDGQGGEGGQGDQGDQGGQGSQGGQGQEFRVLITGATGWLGQFVWAALSTSSAGGEGGATRGASTPTMVLHGTYSSSEVPGWIEGGRSHRLDLEDDACVRDVVTHVRPHCVIHLAALSSPVACQKNPDRAHRVNNPTNLVNAVKVLVPAAFFVFSSTDLVYDGEHAPYSPRHDMDATPPGNVYGETKLAFERCLLSSLPNAVVLRLSNMVGTAYAYRPAGVKFLQWLDGRFLAREHVKLRYDEFRSFVHVADVVNVIVKIVASAAAGAAEEKGRVDQSLHVDLKRVVGRIFNVGGPLGLSRLTLGGFVAKAHGGKTLVTGESGCVDGDGTSATSEGELIWEVSKESNAESVRNSGIVNPRDVTMDSGDTEAVFGFKFESMEKVVCKCLDL